MALRLFLLATLFSSAFLGGAWEKAIPPEKAIPNMEGALQALVIFPGLLAAAEPGLFWGGRVRVVVEASALEEVELRALGGALAQAAPDLGLWEVLIPPDALPALAALPGVRYIRRPHRPLPLGTQGVFLAGAEDWHARGLRGQGVRVAVIDAEFGGVAMALAQGRLRHVVATLDYTGQGFEGGGGHGTACAEIVQDMAPEAELVLMKIDNEVHLARAVEDAIRLGVRVISHSVAWFNTSFYDGTGIVCEIVRRATEAGILWINAAGNFAAGAHWEGLWVDADGDGLLDFASGVNVNTFYAEPLKPLGFWLTWDDWPASAQDFDLYVIHVPTGQVVASSTTTQAGAQPPVEHAFFIPTFPDEYGIVIHGAHVTKSVRLELFVSQSLRLRQAVAESSIPTPADAPFVLAVGAIPWRNWTIGPQAPYSSQGPTNTSRRNPVSHTKPDLMGPVGVDTLTYGPEGFEGTSAAAPHVAGAAALVLSAHPDWTAEQVRFWLESTAVDMGPAGKDNVFGSGRLRLPPPAVLTLPTERTHTYAPPGWHLVSVPTRDDKAGIFGATLWFWDGARYEALSTGMAVDPLRGYWARFPTERTVTAQGSVPQEDQVLELGRAGWHLVSAPWPYPKAAIRVLRGGEEKGWAEAVSAGWVQGSLWGYRAESRAYFSADNLDPWRGYWLYARVPGLSLRFSYRERLSSAAETLTVTESPAERPPPSPPDDAAGAELKFLLEPNPVRTGDTLTFRVLGSPTVSATIVVRIYDLAGRLLQELSGTGTELIWNLRDFAGNILANGVYLCVIEVWSGERRVISPLLRFAILR